MHGKLILLPNLLDENASPEHFFPQDLKTIIQSIQGLIVESEKSARKYLRRFLSHDEMNTKTLLLLNEHTTPKQLDELLDPLKRGEVWGVLSDAGLTCLADPGADLIWKARQIGIQIETITGPSSIIFALQLSGLISQRFAFHGYLPKEQDQLEKNIRDLENRSHLEKATQIFIEAPYRSQKLLQFLISILHPSTRLCVAASLTTSNERVLSQTVEKWKKTSFDLLKEPAVFLFCSNYTEIT